MFLKTKSDRIVQMPTAEEEIAITGIAAAPDTRELDDQWFASAKPASEARTPTQPT